MTPALYSCIHDYNPTDNLMHVYEIKKKTLILKHKHKKNKYIYIYIFNSFLCTNQKVYYPKKAENVENV